MRLSALTDCEVRLIKADLLRDRRFALSTGSRVKTRKERNLHSEVVPSLNRSSFRRSIAQSPRFNTNSVTSPTRQNGRAGPCP
ncbi:MAG TPA: hypothetical protein DCW96_01300, partial [Stenotrophomonas sp.]|nr:hypothetical protein [Stenotrophomonas sp.]